MFSNLFLPFIHSLFSFPCFSLSLSYSSFLCWLIVSLLIYSSLHLYSIHSSFSLSFLITSVIPVSFLNTALRPFLLPSNTSAYITPLLWSPQLEMAVDAPHIAPTDSAALSAMMGWESELYLPRYERLLGKAAERY